jgi:CheY-like chemotaxis protein
VSRDELHRAVAAAFGTAEVPEKEKTPKSTANLFVLNILLAEDNPVNRTVAARLLQKKGHTVHIAVDGVEALEAVERQTFDLILMDIQMPKLDGLDATRRIRETERQSGKHVPIIAMTAHAMTGDSDRCFEAGMDGYLSKPISGERLYKAIEDLKTAVPACSS